MANTPEDASLGSILLEWDVITEDQLQRVLEEQRTLRGDDLLGRLLIAAGYCTKEEIDVAMSAQASIRACKGKKHKCAMAVADIALERRRRQSRVMRTESIQRSAHQLERAITSDNHPAVTSAVLAKQSDG